MSSGKTREHKKAEAKLSSETARRLEVERERDEAREVADAKGMRVHELIEEVMKYQGMVQEIVEFDRGWVGDDAGWGDHVRGIVRKVSAEGR